MGVGKSMKIFMEGMQNSMMSSGYTGKIVNTQMGPFAWDEATNSWVNQNNGFSLPNISLQDLMMYDFGTVSDETESSSGPAFIIDNCIYAVDTSDNRDIGTITTIASFGNVTLSGNSCPINLSLQSTSQYREAFKIYLSVDAGATLTQFTQFSTSITRTDSLNIAVSQFRIYIERNTEYVESNNLTTATISFNLINDNDNETVVATYFADTIGA